MKLKLPPFHVSAACSALWRRVQKTTSIQIMLHIARCQANSNNKNIKRACRAAVNHSQVHAKVVSKPRASKYTEVLGRWHSCSNAVWKSMKKIWVLNKSTFSCVHPTTMQSNYVTYLEPVRRPRSQNTLQSLRPRYNKFRVIGAIIAYIIYHSLLQYNV